MRISAHFEAKMIGMVIGTGILQKICSRDVVGGLFTEGSALKSAAGLF